MIEGLVALAIILAAAAGLFMGAHLTERRRHVDEQAVRRSWETRYESLLGNWGSERELLRLAADAERKLHREEVSRLNLDHQLTLDKASVERERLLTRIQAWAPSEPDAPPAPAGKPESHIAEQSEDELSMETAEKLRAEGFEPTLDGGGFVDQQSGVLFDDLSEAREWRAFCKRNNLPPTTSPVEYFKAG